MPRQNTVLCICCDRWITRHREREHRSRLQTPYSAPSTKILSKLAVITSISSDEGSASCSVDQGEDDEHGQLGDMASLHDSDVQISTGDKGNDAERILRSWVPLRQEAATSSSSDDDESDEAVEGDDEMMDDDEIYPEWDDFQTTVPASDLLSEDYEREAAAVGKPQYSPKEAAVLSSSS